MNFIKPIKINIHKIAQKNLKKRHPWVYESSIINTDQANINSGDLGVIYDEKNKFLAIGFLDINSPIRLRVLQFDKPVNIDLDFWINRISKAFLKRNFDDSTNAFRLINGESDKIPALVLDRYNDVFVIKIYSIALFNFIDHIIEAININSEQLFNFKANIVLRLSRNIQNLAKTEGYFDGMILQGSFDNPVIFKENNIYFEADVLKGQKTGFFLDQRHNRKKIMEMAKNKKILNAFSFSGGFSLYCACAGARKVVSLDISKYALESAINNFKLNFTNDMYKDNLLNSVHRTIQADVFDYLDKNLEKFDLIILDPPSLAKRESERQRAIKAYKKLVSMALKSLEKNGILLAASCSAHVSSEEFFQAIREVAQNSKRKWKEILVTQHAKDHKASFLQAQYLKAIYLQFD